MQILSAPQQVALLKLELAAVIDIGSYFVKATYNLEGDGILAVRCYEEVVKIRAAIAARYYPNVEAVARALFPSNPTHQQHMVQYAISCVQPGIQYFKDRYGSDTTFPVYIFKAHKVVQSFQGAQTPTSSSRCGYVERNPFAKWRNYSAQRGAPCVCCEISWR